MRVAQARTQGGFTLLELLVSMGLLASLGVLLVSLVDSSFEMYANGDRRADLYQSGLHVLGILEDDIAAVHAGPEGRFLLFNMNKQGTARGDGFFLRLVRTLPDGEQRHEHLRPAGSEAGASGLWDGQDPGIGSRKTVAPPSGLMEVAYALIQEKDDPAGLLTLYRGVRAPALEQGGFFDEEVNRGIDETWVRKNLKPVATDILGLWILCFSQNSEEWLEEEVMNGRSHSEGATALWDSTRAYLNRDDFAFAVSPASLKETRDDIYPSRVRLVAQVARGYAPDATLRTPLEPGDKSIAVGSTRGFPPFDEDAPAYVKVENEWLRLSSIDASDAVVQRARRRTKRARNSVAPGTPVYAGMTFRKTLQMSVHRSHWGGENP